MDHAPFHGNIKIEIPGPPLQYHATTPHQHDATTPQFSTPPFLSSTTTSTASCLTCSQYLASQSRGVQQLLLRGLFGKKWPTQDTTEGGMAKQPWELDPAHHATRAGSWITDGNYKMVLSATARQDMILRNFYQKANGCTAETTPWLLCRYTHYLAWPTNWGKLFGFLIKIEHITHCTLVK